jgi:putative addiction module component (TIGR02574 family)
MRIKTMNTADLMTEATSLPLEERAKLVDSLLQTLNPTDTTVTDAWLALAQSRLDDIDSGRVATIPGEAVFSKVVQRLAR